MQRSVRDLIVVVKETTLVLLTVTAAVLAEVAALDAVGTVVAPSPVGVYVLGTVPSVLGV